MSHLHQKYTWWAGLVVVVVGLVSPTFADDKDFKVFPGDGVDGPPLVYKVKDNRGTITDRNTGLIWEQKLAEDDPACTALAQADRSVHCVNNAYTWSRINTNPDCIGTAPDGTLFTDFLFRLNHRCAKDETISCTRNDDCDKVGGKCGFAGYRDWRIPNIRELQSIVDYGRCAVNDEFDACQDEAAIHPDFSPTAPHNYWSSTSTVAEPTLAWIVNFDDGDGDSACKDKPARPDNGTLLYGRAVRGGR